MFHISAVIDKNAGTAWHCTARTHAAARGDTGTAWLCLAVVVLAGNKCERYYCKGKAFGGHEGNVENYCPSSNSAALLLYSAALVSSPSSS